MAFHIDITEPAAVPPGAMQAFVPMRDGVSLAIDVHLPEGDGPWPCVLVRLPYDKDGRYCWMPSLAPYFTARGYAFLPQDVRGKFRSEGETNAFVHEVEDGFDTIEWITRQPWCDGAVGMWGDSYYGFTQWAAVASRHPALKAIVPRVTMANLLEWLDGVTPLYGAHYLAEHWTQPNDGHFTPDWTRRPPAEVFEEAFAALGARSIAFDRILAEARGQAPVELYPDGDPLDLVRIPTLHGVGWYDNITPPHMRDYERLMANPETAPFQYLHAGSTDHENYQFEQVPVTPDTDHATNDAAMDAMLERYITPAIDFFDAFLSGRTDPRAVPRVRWHLAGRGWQESPAWPPPGAQEHTLRLTSAAGLTAGSAGQPGVLTWLHDPSDLVPSTIANPFAFLLEYPDENAVAERDDVLTFVTEPLPGELVLAGPVSVDLDVSSDAAAMHLHVKLVVVGTDDAAHALVYNQIRLETHGGWTRARLQLGHTARVLHAGERLRLQVCSSDYPLYLPYPGTDESPWFATQTRTNGQAIRTGGEAPSLLSLTVLER